MTHSDLGDEGMQSFPLLAVGHTVWFLLELYLHPLGEGTVPDFGFFLYYLSYVLLFYLGYRESDNLYFSLLTGRG